MLPSSIMENYLLSRTGLCCVSISNVDVEEAIRTVGLK